MSKRKQAVEVAKEGVTGGHVFSKPICSGRLLLDVGVGGGYGEDGFASGGIVLALMVPVVNLDAQDLCQTMAKLGRASGGCHPDMNSDDVTGGQRGSDGDGGPRRMIEQALTDAPMGWTLTTGGEVELR